jgi:alkanesulfonate monooxygenase SsuD/methylene tetrahydromethanopterin reductase-like flavin-dependent oxidoreductase (luciferase family)
MKIGITIDNPSTAIADATQAEELGFDIIGCGEHLFFHGPTPNAFAMLAAAAGATSDIRLVSSVALLPLYPATLVAKLASVIDVISNGRFNLGVGAGGEFRPEFIAAGIDPATRFRRTDEGIAVIRQLFAGQKVTYDGEFTTVPGLKLNPPPAQDGGPPIWIGGRKPGALRRAGRYADVWMPYMVDPVQLRQGLVQVQETASAQGRSDDVSAALFAWIAVDADGSWAKDTGISTVSSAYQQDFSPLADRYLLLGEPTQVADRLAEFAQAGVRTVLAQVAARTAADRNRIIDNLANRLLPLVKTL